MKVRLEIFAFILFIIVLLISFLITDADAFTPAFQSQSDEIAQLSYYISQRKTNQPTEICDIIAREVVTQTHKNNLPVELIVGIIEIESMWNPYAKSKIGAKGLMQVYKEDGVKIDPEKVYDIAYNIYTGLEILKSKLRKSKGDLNKALWMYVGGDDKYRSEVYRFMGRFILFKMNSSYEETINKIIIQVPNGKIK